MDVIADLAYPLPVTVICDMLGVPAGDHEQIKEWSSDIIRSLDAIGIPSDESIVERGRIGRRGIADYFRALLPERRRHPRADLLSSLIAVEEQGDRLTEGELLATCVLLFIAGHETTVNLIGNGLLALLRHPGGARAPSPGARRSSAARWRSCCATTARCSGRRRITNADVELGGKTIPKGAFVVTAIGAANRDPAHFPDPDRLDVARRRQPPHRVRLRHPLLPGRPARAGGGPARAGDAAATDAAAAARRGGPRVARVLHPPRPQGPPRRILTPTLSPSGERAG